MKIKSLTRIHWLRLLPLAAIVMTAAIIQSCKEDEVTPPVVATLTTTQVSSITSATATSGGEITANGGAKITARGICWGKTSNPTIEDSKTSDGTGSGIYASSLTELETATVYYVRAYATNSAGTAYGNEVSFTTSASVPVLLTATFNLSGITKNSAWGRGTVVSNGGSPLIYYGVQVSSTQDFNDNGFLSESGVNGEIHGEFSLKLSGLSHSTTYYARAVAENNVGTSYGPVVSFKTSDVVTDIDGYQYGIVKIGDKFWMQEDLRVTRFSNGDAIPTTTPATLDISGEVEPKYQWIYDNNNNLLVHFGRLYTGFVAVDERNVCPTGWHVPSGTEMANMNAVLGNSTNNGHKLREKDGFYWVNSNTATNEVGFFARAAGMRSPTGGFSGLVEATYYLTTDKTGDNGIFWVLTKDDDNNFSPFYDTFKNGFSIRCVKD
jgi:uncharacterized protein (TIGR02145 family)